MPTLRRLCPGCRRVLIASPAVRCPTCQRARDAARGTTTARGLGYHYQRARAKVLAVDTICWICHKPGADTADHLIPRSRGGESTVANLRPAHSACNSRRGDRP